MENGEMNNKISEFRSYKNELDIVKNIEGLLVPGQEKTFMVIASKLPKNARVLEIGSFKGKSASCIGLASPKSTKIYAIDTFEGNNKDFSEGVQFTGGSFLNEFKQNLKKSGVSKKVIPLKGLSYEIGKNWNKTIDFLFIDGSHLYEDVKKDFEIFYPWVKEGGIIALHDVSRGHPGVLKFWKEEASKKLINHKNVHTLFFGTKPSKSKAQESIKLVNDIYDESTKQKVFAVLPVFNRLEYTKKCLDSFSSQSYKNIKLILVDDGSTDGTYKYVKDNFPDVKLIKGNGDWFWTKSINEGIKWALSKSEANDFVLTMNNDCFFEKKYIENIVRCSNDNYRSIVGSFIIDPANPDKVLDAGVIIDWQNAHIYGLPERKPFAKDYYGQVDHLTGIDTLPGKGTLIPVETFEKIGLFNNILLPHYLADYEFFNRAKTKGINIIIGIKAKLFNFSKETGTEHGGFHHKAGYKEVINTLFSRRSKVNIMDHLFFILLRCPKKYIFKNFKLWFLKLLNYLLLLFPFYYIKIFISLWNKFCYLLKINIYRLRVKIRQYFFEK